MRIADTLSARGVEVPLGGGGVRIYLCGVTVYDDSHIGHARTVVVFDVLRRHLEGGGTPVELVQNFTDVDDKIIGRSRAEGVPAGEISRRYIDGYHRDFDGLRVRRASLYPRATSHIGDMIGLIKELVGSGAAYVSRNGVYFSVSSFPGYGRLSRKRADELRAGARVEVDEDKRDPADFALWKFADSGPRWDSPWGAGRPGWHIECSAMSLRYLGSGFDIHGGGRDLIFPHHENEMAQSEARTGRQLARCWMHVGMVTIDGEKMSKSAGNVRPVRRVLEEWGPNVTRLFCLSAHYSKPIDYSDSLMAESLARWRQAEAAYFELIHAGAGGPAAAPPAGALRSARECGAEFAAGLDDDLDTRRALSAFFGLVREVNRLAASGGLDGAAAGAIMPEIRRCMGVLGLEIPEITGGEISAINAKVARRDEMRRAGRYGEADRIRDEISSMGVELLDHGSATSWVRRERIGPG